ncbi:hypothetical protein QJS10_CPB11g02003 [Acorus calamus]|uniref:Uncharacterized protein n=1 Tax=Acorus calamus TaxID=4465 RepID=A0AAV9DRI2_ACOCL|nr:hypothetical protein QJS10_CPB11g02003 [Acorus calamus]
MSRCFSYPPPGYVREEAKIELPEKEKEQTKERREKKREKKEKSREHQSTDKKKRKREKRHDDQRILGENAKKRDSDSENVEKSGLTEEQGLPNYDQNSPDTDSTRKIAKIIHLSPLKLLLRKKQGASSSGCHQSSGSTRSRPAMMGPPHLGGHLKLFQPLLPGLRPLFKQRRKPPRAILTALSRITMT